MFDEQANLILAGLLFVAVLGIMYGSKGSSHPALILGPIFNYLGIDHPWALTGEEIRSEFNGTVLTWDMVGQSTSEGKPESIGNYPAASPADEKSEVIRFRNPTKIELTKVDSRVASGDFVRITFRFPHQIQGSQHILLVVMADPRFPASRLTKNVRFNLLHEPLPLELFISKKEFPLRLKLIHW